MQIAKTAMSEFEALINKLLIIRNTGDKKMIRKRLIWLSFISSRVYYPRSKNRMGSLVLSKRKSEIYKLR